MELQIFENSEFGRVRTLLDEDGAILFCGCGGELIDWVNGINEMLTKEGILQNGSTFTEVSENGRGGSNPIPKICR